MGKTAVIFKSSYGATRKYAMYIAQELDAELYDLDRVKQFEFDKFDTVVLGGGIYAGKINGIKFIASNAEKLDGKTVVVFTTGLADPTVAKNLQNNLKSVNKSLPKELRSKVHVYSFRGGIYYSKMSFIHKMMMSMLKKMIERKKEGERTEDDNNILNSFGKDADFTDMASASALIDFVKGLNK